MSDFKKFADAFHANFTKVSANELYRVNVTGDEIWEKYLASFPAGTNEIFRKRPYHDGSYDRSTIRAIGNVVYIDTEKNEIKSIFNIPGLPYPYDIVCAELSNLVEKSTIVSVFRHELKKIGHVKNNEMINDRVHVWHHLNVVVANRHHTRTVGKDVGAIDSKVGVFKRGLLLSPSALETVYDLICSNAIYRGREFKDSVHDFITIQEKYLALPTEQERDIFVWSQRPNNFKNTVIGGLVENISSGESINDAVRKYESQVAPQNYKRTSAPVTQAMVKKAMETIEELGIEDSLSRRFANITDVSIGDVLWANSAAKHQMVGSKLQNILEKAVTPKPLSKKIVPEDILMEDFYKLLPNATDMEVLVTGQNKKNLVTMTAPAHADAKNIFKWDNAFGWSYIGNITDSIKEKVKTAGGNTNAALRVSLAWFNYDDLDIHAICPDGHIYFSNKMKLLDVDMNAGSGRSREPVENISWVNPKNGKYKIYINQFCKRETTNEGFVVEFENNGDVRQFKYERPVQGNVNCIEFNVSNGIVTDLKVLDSNVKEGGISEDVWGIQTEKFVTVETLLNSPNHWNGQAIGNKHWFFILKDCQCDEEMRGIYNEFLSNDLNEHRKVFDLVGEKTKCVPTETQLSGIGFSETKGETVVVRLISKKMDKVYRVII